MNDGAKISLLKGAVPALLLAAVLGPQPALAQDDAEPREADREQTGEAVKDLDDVVIEGRMTRYSALKSDTPIMETARSVSVETERQLLDKGALELADAYVYAAGVYGETYGFATRGDWVKVRGLNVPEYRDSLQALFGYYNNTRPHIYTIEQVEILKGPASVLYGQGSPGGLVNIVSKLPEARHRDELVLQYGSFDHRQIAADVGGALNGDDSLLYRVVAVYRDSGTQVDFVQNDIQVLSPSLTWSPAAGTNITLLGNFQKNDGDTGAQFVPIAGTLYPAANGEFIESDSYFGEPSFNRYITESRSVTLLADHVLNGVWTLEANARWTDGEADYHQAWPSFIGGDRYVYNPDGTLYRDGMVPRTFYESDAWSEQYAVDVRLRAEFMTGAWAHELMLGLQYQDVETENDFSYAYALGYDFATGGPDAVYGDTYWINLFNPVYGNVPPDSVLDMFFTDGPVSNTRDRGLYLNDQLTYGNWHVTAGLRFDDVRTGNGTTVQQDDAVSGSIGALYGFDNGLAPYASYAESFEPVVGVDNITQAPLKPQEGRQYEVGVKYQPLGNGTRITVAAFDIEQSNLPTPSSFPGAPSQQEGVAEIRGLEVEAFTRFGDFTLEANASRLETEDPEGFRFASVPENQASAWLGWRPQGAWRGFKAGFGLRYVGKSYDGSDNIVTPSYTLSDLMIGYVLDNWDFTLNARNLADKEYLATCLDREDCFFGERRTVVGTLAYRFD